MSKYIILFLCLPFGPLSAQTAVEYYNKGNAKYDLGDYRGAILDYGKAIQFNPNFADAYFNMGLTKLLLDDIDGGCLDLSKAGELGYSKAYASIREFC